MNDSIELKIEKRIFNTLNELIIVFLIEIKKNNFFYYNYLLLSFYKFFFKIKYPNIIIKFKFI